MKCIYKKRIYKPVTKIIAYKDTFTYITKSNKQYIHPDKEVKLPFTPQDCLYHDKFYYLAKNGLVSYKDDNYNKVRLPVKISSINKLEERVIVCEKKIMKLEDDKIVEQVYGPTMQITHTDTFDGLILAICFGSYNIYLFRDKNHAVYECDELINYCCFVDDESFFVSSDKCLYLYDVNKRAYLKKFDIENITTLKNVNGKVYAGNSNGQIYKYADKTVEEILQIDGNVNDLHLWNDKLVIASSTGLRNAKPTNKKCRNMIWIYE